MCLLILLFFQVMVDKCEKNDEITQHINASWFGDTNSLWRLFEFQMSEMSPSVQKLAIHLPNQEWVHYDPAKIQTEEQLQQVINSQRRTTLVAFFELNQKDPEANHILYCDILRYYTWDKNKKAFKRRVYRSGMGVTLGEKERRSQLRLEESQ